MMMIRSTVIVMMFFVMAGMQTVYAADLPEAYLDIPEPAVKQYELNQADQKGIWAAIAYSEIDSKHGFFWGADKRPEAEEIALQHCKNAGGVSCTVVTVFRNHRHWNDDDGSGFPYNHCGALAVSKNLIEGKPAWGAISAPTRKEAEEMSLQACETGGAQCKIREWVCT